MSDGLTDCARSERIAGVSHSLTESEILFLSKPTRKNLDNIYRKCDELERCPRGYWGETGQYIAIKTGDYFKAQFDGFDRVPKIRLKDVAFFLSTITEDERLYCLASIVACREVAELESDNFFRRSHGIYNKLKEKTSVSDYNHLTSETIDDGLIGKLFNSIGFKL